ncbi:MAG: hypothetical protein AB7G12_05780 [Thermoanaerobaculia bacterium]
MDVEQVEGVALVGGGQHLRRLGAGCRGEPLEDLLGRTVRPHEQSEVVLARITPGEVAVEDGERQERPRLRLRDLAEERRVGGAQPVVTALRLGGERGALESDGTVDRCGAVVAGELEIEVAIGRCEVSGAVARRGGDREAVGAGRIRRIAGFGFGSAQRRGGRDEEQQSEEEWRCAAHPCAWRSRNSRGFGGLARARATP